MSPATPDHTIPTPGDHLRHADRLARLERVWANGPGLVGQLTAVNHSTVSMRFIVTVRGNAPSSESIVCHRWAFS